MASLDHFLFLHKTVWASVGKPNFLPVFENLSNIQTFQNWMILDCLNDGQVQFSDLSEFTNFGQEQELKNSNLGRFRANNNGESSQISSVMRE